MAKSNKFWKDVTKSLKRTPRGESCETVSARKDQIKIKKMRQIQETHANDNKNFNNNLLLVYFAMLHLERVASWAPVCLVLVLIMEIVCGDVWPFEFGKITEVEDSD